MVFSKIFPSIDCKYNDVKILGITSDSRLVKSGYVFVCINGPLNDGHKYAQSAYEKGAAVIIAERDVNLPNQIIVDDTHDLFFSGCANWFDNPLKKMKLVGVTGTNGKTSVSYMVKTILEEAGHKCGLIGTIQHMIGDE